MRENVDLSTLFGEDLNPGERLRKLLEDIYSLDLGSESSFLSKMDADFRADGDLIDLVYASTINYLLRRLINTGEFLRRKYEENYESDSKTNFIDILREFLQAELSINEAALEKILSGLLLCMDVKRQNRKITKIKRKKLIKKTIQDKGELRCYICGKAVTDNETQIEHGWPKSMGGTEEAFNLKVSCSYCNGVKEDFIDHSDFHYEEICLVGDEGDESFETNFKKMYKVALWAKSDYKCILCNAEAATVGRLKFGRKNPSDSWHFLNIDAYCESCLQTGE